MSNDIPGFKFRPYQRWQPGPWPPKTRARRRGGAEERRGPMMYSHPTCRKRSDKYVALFPLFLTQVEQNQGFCLLLIYSLCLDTVQNLSNAKSLCWANPFCQGPQRRGRWEPKQCLRIKVKTGVTLLQKFCRNCVGPQRPPSL